MIQKVCIDQLHAHPENSNRMSSEILDKLRRHIGHTGNYEPLVVRQHPTRTKAYQVINGHHRLQVLRSLGRETANCVVWNIDDKQARLYLATLNRLAGQDVPERRAALLNSLLGEFSVEELSSLLPDEQKELEALKRLTRIAEDELPSCDFAAAAQLQIPHIIDFVLDQDDARQVNQALDIAMSEANEDVSRSEALVKISRFYIDHQV